MLKNLSKKYNIKFYFLVLVLGFAIFSAPYISQAILTTAPPRIIATGDVTTAEIKDLTITGADISHSASTTMYALLVSNLTASTTVSFPTDSITDAMVVDTLTASNYLSLTSWFATTTAPQLVEVSQLTLAATSTFAGNLKVSGAVEITSMAEIDDAIFTNWPTMPAGNPTNDTDAVSKKYVDDKPAGVDINNITAGENIKNFEAVGIASSTLKTIQLSNEVGLLAGTASFGTTGAQKKIAQGITPDGTVSFDGVGIGLKDHGTPTDNVNISIQYGTLANGPNGYKVASTSVSGGTITGSLVEYSGKFDPVVNISTSTSFWIVAERDGALSDVNYYSTSVDTGNVYPGGRIWLYDSSWTAWTATHDFGVWILEYVESGEAYVASASRNEFSAGFAGLAKATTTKGSTLNIAVCDVFTATTTLVAHQLYYLSNATGTISTTAGTNSVKVGHALTTGQLFINRDF